MYASEARGYAPLIFFVLLAFDAHERYLENSAPAALVTFWTAVIFGLLSHLTFVHAYVAVLLWSAYASWTCGNVRAAVRRMIALHMVPLVFLVALDFVYIRNLRIAGAEPAAVSTMLAETFATALGASPQAAWWMPATVIVVLLIVALPRLRKQDPGLSLAFLAGILLVPAVTVIGQMRGAIIEPRFFPRYFLVSITLLLLLASWIAGEYYGQGRWKRLVASGGVLVFVTANLWQVSRFIVGGRGQYRAAVRYMAEHSPGRPIRVSSNSDVRTSVLLAFYARDFTAGTTMVFVPHARTSAAEAEWRIVEDLDPVASPPAQLDEGSRRFRLVKRFPFYGLSGCQWTLYERMAPADDGLRQRSKR